VLNVKLKKRRKMQDARFRFHNTGRIESIIGFQPVFFAMKGQFIFLKRMLNVE